MAHRTEQSTDEGEVVTWRPAGASFRNVMIVGTGLGVGALVTTAATSIGLAVVAAGAGVAASLALTFLSVRRLRAGLERPEEPHFLNWPGTVDEQRRLRRAGAYKGANAAAVGLVLGLIGGMVPSVGVALIGAGTATAVTASYLRWMVASYETDRHVTVFAAPGALRRKAGHRFGVGVAGG